MRIGVLLIGLLLILGTAFAGDRPPPASWAMDRAIDSDLAAIDRVEFSALDLEALAVEDAGREAMGKPPRFAYGHATTYSPTDRGTWDALNDTRIWRLRVAAEEAVLLNFGFEDFHLPEGARLYIYHPKAAHAGKMDRHLVIGPYDASQNRAHGEFWTPNLAGDEAIIEVNVPADRVDQLRFTIQQVSQGYRGFGHAALDYRQSTEERTAGDGKQACEDTAGARSGACNQDVACLSEDDPWNDPVRSVGAYQRSGTLACTGSLVNNTANDQRMLFVTATHCINEGQTPSIVVYWNYEWPTCRRPGASGGTSTNPPDPNLSQSGGTFLAATSNPFQGQCTAPDECSDMTLVELDGQANPDFELHWSGWDRRPPPTACGESTNGVTDNFCASIHHPGVHEKRITWVDSDMQVGNIAGASGIHWHPFWHPNPPELPNMPGSGPIPPAVTEPGSSGSPLYSADRRFIGVLSGGEAFCGATGSALSDLYGGLWHAWDGMGTSTTRMRDHLDPLGSEPEFIDGIDGDGFDIEPETTTPGQCGFDDYELAIDIEQRGDFSDPVTLTASGLPAGVTGDFSVNPVDVPGSSVLTLGSLDQAGNGSFEFAIEGEGGGEAESVTINFTQFDDQPAPVTLMAPSDGAEDTSLSPTLEWSADELATEFLIEVATNDDFTDVVYSAVTEDQAQQVGIELETGTVYYWRVQAGNLCGDAWSDAFSFTTRLEPEAQFSATAFNLEVPEDSTDSTTLEIANVGTGNLTWSIVTDQPESGGLRSHDPALDEVLDVPDFTVESLANNGEPVSFTLPAGTDSRGEVVGFSFQGTASGVSGNGDWASDTCMIIEGPDGSSYTVGGISGSFADCDTNDWDFQGSGSGDDGTYSSSHDDVFSPPGEDQGDWTLTFVHDWNSGSANPIDWSNVTVTLHKAPLPVCGDELTQVDWLAVDPVSGVVGEGDSQSVNVLVNTIGLDVGQHIGYLCVETNATNAELVPMPVELEVTEQEVEQGIIAGQVTSLGYCQDDPSPLANTLVTVNGQSVMTAADGSYAVGVEVEQAPVTVSFSHPNHRGQSAVVDELTDGETVTVDADLVLRSACAQVDPSALGFTLIADDVSEQLLVVSNAAGGSDLQWSLETGNGCFDPAEDEWLNLSHTGGVIAWGNVREVTVTADSSGLENGSYSTTLCLATDDAQQESIAVPVELQVVDPLIFEDRFEAAE